MSRPLRVDLSAGGALCEIALDQPKGNVLDEPLMDALAEALRGLPQRSGLRAICLRAEGEHFSYGASVQEHRAEQIGAALERLDRVLRLLLEAPAPTIACVQGLCLGGGFELVLACDLVLAAADARFALPEIELAVFPPAAAALLPLRLPANEASRLMLTGARLDARRAHALGMVQEILEGDLRESASHWALEAFGAKSADALRHAARAARAATRSALERDWPAHRSHYLTELMREPDATEGVEAFLTKRAPRWRD